MFISLLVISLLVFIWDILLIGSWVELVSQVVELLMLPFFNISQDFEDSSYF